MLSLQCRDTLQERWEMTTDTPSLGTRDGMISRYPKLDAVALGCRASGLSGAELAGPELNWGK